eukprot:755264-Hanusia_phi.AAC.2
MERIKYESKSFFNEKCKHCSKRKDQHHGAAKYCYVSEPSAQSLSNSCLLLEHECRGMDNGCSQEVSLHALTAQGTTR